MDPGNASSAPPRPMPPDSEADKAIHSQRATTAQQFCAVLRKNFLLQTRSRKACCGIGGWAALLIEVNTGDALKLLCVLHVR